MRCSHHVITAAMCGVSGETEAGRQRLRNPLSLRLKMKTAALRLSSRFPQQNRPLLGQGRVLKDHLAFVFWGPGKQEAEDCLLRPWFQHLPDGPPQEAAETSIRLYWMPAELCLWPKLRGNLQCREQVGSEVGRAWQPSLGVMRVDHAWGPQPIPNPSPPHPHPTPT